jgi:hypothetical protein
MQNHQPEKQASSLPLEWLNVSDIYNPGLVRPFLENARLPNGIKPAQKAWNDKAKELSLQGYTKFMKGQFRNLAAADPRAPVDLVVQWAAATGKPPATTILALWLGELLSLAHSNASPETLNIKVRNALNDSNIWDGAFSIGRGLWGDRSKTQIRNRLNAWLADHVAAHLWGGHWVIRKYLPQTARKEPYAHERKNPDLWAAWQTMRPEDAVKGGQLERTLGVPRDQNYNPNHPLAVAVKNERPKVPSQGEGVFELIFTVAPLAIHHGWSSVDILRCLLLLRPGWAAQFSLDDSEGRAKGSRYVRRQLLKPIGLDDLADRGRPSGGDCLPPAFGLARNAALLLRGYIFS